VTYSEAVFHVAGVLAIAKCVWDIARDSHRVRHNRRICSNPRDCDRFASWRVHAQQLTRRSG
jgi:hypothetical protein